jgi:hypothetical protein
MENHGTTKHLMCIIHLKLKMIRLELIQINIIIMFLIYFMKKTS